MIYTAIGNLLDKEYTHIIHQANLFHTFGSGLALQIKKKYPEAYLADLRTTKGDKKRLGTFSKAATKDGPIVYNLYSQVGIGSKDRQTSYDAMEVGLRAIRDDLRKDAEIIVERLNVGIPYKLGSGLANGNWKIVEAIVDSIFMDEDYHVTIVSLPGS